MTEKEKAEAALFEGWLHDTTGIPIGIIRRMEDADDWTFVITLHAMIEAVLNNMIVVKLGHPELRGIISNTDTGDRQRGKLALAKTLDLLSERERKFIRILSELRNDIVHNISEFEFSFAKWISEMEPVNFKNLKNAMPESMPEGLETEDDVFIHWDRALKEQPRQSVLTAAMWTITSRQMYDGTFPIFGGQFLSTPKESEPPHQS